ncbi:hypothetical protein SASPL_121434 [Salvia splendens]|uniref:Nudix hydrolase domain-containing protein n=1 Tax=Salvia splendens TaxID=180675 RepID=A0A8X8ZW69_SALSN|nr:hypothetical protein SASPL_155942 [Salvia splendens]KAG6419218.1 hypothetical protein SASPL_121434 [Salvia splendens]
MKELLHRRYCERSKDMSSNNKSGLRSIAEILRRHDTTNSSRTAGKLGSNRAAVVICLFQGKEGHLRVILTQRSSTISSHSGEVALPGGKWEEGDDTHAATALREANEEIGLDPSIVKSSPFSPPSAPSFSPILNPSEVESVFDVPLEMFLKNENRREETVELMGESFLVHYFDYETENRCYTIWAVTASILIKAASIIYQRPPAFEEHKPTFWGRSRH